MTAAMQGLTGLGTPATQQQGAFTPSFPAPIGAEYPGLAQQYGTQMPPGLLSPQQEFPPQSQQVIQQLVQQLVSQILPIVQQTIVAHVLGMVAQQIQQQLPQLIGQHVQQQIQQHLPRLVTQQVQQQLPLLAAQQQGGLAGGQQLSGSWAQPFTGGQQSGLPFTQQAGFFGQGNRPYSGLS